MKERLDVVLVEQGIFETREKAKRAVMAGLVIVDEKKIEKAGTAVKKDAKIRLKAGVLDYVGRGGLKLEKAIKVFEINCNEKKVLDVGSSTGGFTDCALQNGAKKVYAVDVGTNQLAWKLRQDERVISLENMHIKNLTLNDIENEKVDLIVMDVSFISIRSVFQYLKNFLKENGNMMALIKPQFEVGRENISKGGIVKDFNSHEKAIKDVIEDAKENGFYIKSLDISPITGTKGNVEYISYYSKEEILNNIDIKEVIEKGKRLKEGV